VDLSINCRKKKERVLGKGGGDGGCARLRGGTPVVTGKALKEKEGCGGTGGERWGSNVTEAKKTGKNRTAKYAQRKWRCGRESKSRSTTAKTGTKKAGGKEARWPGGERDKRGVGKGGPHQTELSETQDGGMLGGREKNESGKGPERNEPTVNIGGCSGWQTVNIWSTENSREGGKKKS